MCIESSSEECRPCQAAAPVSNNMRKGMEEQKEKEHEQSGKKLGEMKGQATAAEPKAEHGAAEYRDSMAQGMAAGMNPGEQGRTAWEQENEPPRHHQWAGQTVLPPGYAVDPLTGQVVFTGQAAPQPQYMYAGYSAPQAQSYAQPAYFQAETPEQAAARQAEAQKRHGRIVRSFEQFAEGDATVSDVVRTLYSNTAQNDQLWKGVLVGAAATILLTSKPARTALGKTLSGFFGSAKSGKASTTEPDGSNA